MSLSSDISVKNKKKQIVVLGLGRIPTNFYKAQHIFFLFLDFSVLDVVVYYPAQWNDWISVACDKACSLGTIESLYQLLLAILES